MPAKMRPLASSRGSEWVDLLNHPFLRDHFGEYDNEKGRPRRPFSEFIHGDRR
jgi:hypothetical protein